MRRVLVLMGDGINSENELAQAFSEHGAKVDKQHVNKLLQNPNFLNNYDLLALPGGFSFGDELRSGKILAEKMKNVLTEGLTEFLRRDGRVIGICNGFQVLAQLGAFDWEKKERSFTLAENNHGKFMNRWVRLHIASHSSEKSPWFKNLDGELYLPVRHREGRIIRSEKIELPFAPLHYEEDINGSHQRIAGVVGRDGQVFGLMPHPEVATKEFLYPFKEDRMENVKKIHQLFKNGLK